MLEGEQDVRLMTVWMHFYTRDAYYDRVERNARRIRTHIDHDFASARITAANAVHYGSWEPPHQFNDVAAFIEVIWDGYTTVKSYAYVARPRKSPRTEFGRAPRRDLKEKRYLRMGKVSEVHFHARPKTTEEFQAALRQTEEQLSSWARERRWAMTFDTPLIEATDWLQYVALARQSPIP